MDDLEEMRRLVDQITYLQTITTQLIAEKRALLARIQTLQTIVRQTEEVWW